MQKSFAELAEAYQALKQETLEAKDREFPKFKFVKVSNGGQAFVFPDGQCPPHKVPVMFCNGNVWWRSPSELEDMKPEEAGIELLGHYTRRGGKITW
jgi:hypothetical protein